MPVILVLAERIIDAFEVFTSSMVGDFFLGSEGADFDFGIRGATGLLYLVFCYDITRGRVIFHSLMVYFCYLLFLNHTESHITEMEYMIGYHIIFNEGDVTTLDIGRLDPECPKGSGGSFVRAVVIKAACSQVYMGLQSSLHGRHVVTFNPILLSLKRRSLGRFEL